MNIAYRFRIYPNREQEVLIAKTFGCSRFLYNQMLNDKIGLSKTRVLQSRVTIYRL